MTKGTGLLPFGDYSVIFSNCDGFSVMLPPVTLFLKGLTNCTSGFDSALLLRIEKSIGRTEKRPANWLAVVTTVCGELR